MTRELYGRALLELGSSNMYDSLVPRLRTATGRGAVGIVRLRTGVSKQCDFFIQKQNFQKPKICSKNSKSTQNAGKIHSVAMATNIAAKFVQPVSATRKPTNVVFGKIY